MSKDNLAAYYADRAGEYERIYHKPERQQDLKTLKEIVAQAFAGLRVIEIACGTGYWTEVISRTAASVTATDINEEVLAVARAKQLNPQRVTFRKGDALAPLAGENYNAGLAVFWWSHVPRARLRSFLQNFHSTLEPGARVVFIDNVYVEGSSTPVSRADANGDTYQVRKRDDGSAHEVLKNFPAAEELRSAVTGISRDVQIEFLRYYWMLSYETAAHSAGR